MKTIFGTIALGIITLSATAQWTEVRNAGFDYLQSIHFISADTGFISGLCAGNIYRTQDGGTTWDTAATIYTGDSYSGFSFPDGQTGYASGVNFTFDYHDIGVKTTDGGTTWDTLHITDSINLVNYSSVDFINENNGVFVGWNSFITHDGGNTFEHIVTPPVADPSYFSFTDIKMLMPYHLVASGSEYTDGSPGSVAFPILTTEDGGTTWTERYTDTALIEHLFFLDHNTGWAFTHKNLLHTTDAGVTWGKTALSFLSSGYYIGGLAFTDETNGWMAVNVIRPGSAIWDGYLYHTIDGGTTWSVDFTSDSAEITGISILSDKAGYLITPRKVFKKTSNGAGLEHNLLSQNAITIYPNPSDGVVHIDSKSNLTITGIQLTDIAGRAAAGFHYADKILDLKTMPVGIYLLHITAKEGDIIKKIVLQ